MNASEERGSSVLRQLLAFVPMCALAAVAWAELLVDPPVGRVIAVVAVATACGLVLTLTARLEPDGRREARIVRVVTVAVALVVGALAAGVPPALLAPGGWGQLLIELRDGVDELPRRWPYGGDDLWVRRTVLLAIPLMAVPAAAFALWPPAAGPGGREAAAARRFGALLLLLSLIGFAGAERPLADPTPRGVLLLLALVAWLFVPRVRARPSAALAASAAVVVAGLASLPLATALEPGRAPADRPSPRPSATPPSASADRDRPDRSRQRRQPRSEQRRSGGRDRSGSASRDRPRPRPRPAPGGEAGSPPGVTMLIVLAVAALVSLLVARRIRRGALLRTAADEAEELRTALERLGWSVPPQTTLAELERRLGEGAGPVAAGYARGLRERRFGVSVPSPSQSLDRRALRRALTAGRGPRGRLRGLIALPPAALQARR